MRQILNLVLSLSLAMTPAIASGQSLSRLSTTEAVKTAVAMAEAPPPDDGTRGKGALVGALIGAGAALIVTGWAAASYGENEGGKFCTPCMVQWSALSVPVGAGLGAGIGFAVATVRQSAGPSGPRPGRQTSITFSTRF